MFAYPIHFDWLLIYATGAQAASTVNALSTRVLTWSPVGSSDRVATVYTEIAHQMAT